ncbi:4Fe-4S binding protein [Desulfosudis oleivorans]|uniref:4Fe-4S ferredoxin iron-sulfur binding domain protein n=1 Tax=Desulfosudis oleivorans (strain DSM 6200 / JCM 39069 / Hxd3) TaxID=96561 RepID=A8ZSM0_DESOH|nr:4Fe-4S binding protein [Desulfosudis oleivorans]ABW65933.1 4Fe-4S ferredoxin iron-sulfur binding domain protein [Desulfosudis oleivorans Hxd3]
MEKRINDVLTLLDNKSYLRTFFFRFFAMTTMDYIKFVYWSAEKSRTPVIGRLFKFMSESYYKNVHTSAIKLPLKDIEDVILNCDHVSVGPCPCRIIFDDGTCKAPVYTCIKINYFSKMTTKLEKIASHLRKKRGMRVGNKHSKELTKDEALEIVRNSRKHDLIFSLESCIQPYQNNICACCTDCCIELNGRYKFGLDVSPKGPYMPVVKKEACKKCMDCVNRCPVKAISHQEDTITIDMGLCLGCGICTEKCPHEAMELVVDTEYIPSYVQPGFFKMIYICCLTMTVFFFFIYYKLTRKSINFMYSKAEPRESDLIQADSNIKTN